MTQHRILAMGAGLALFAAGCASPMQQWKGNLHTHSLWSDGADFPEMIADWYRTAGYDFLAFTEHDLLQTVEGRWVDMNAPDPGWPPRNASAKRAIEGYRERFGTAWVQEHEDGARHLVRVRPLAEYRHLFEEPGEFLLLVGEEITDRAGTHMNAFNLASAIQPSRAETAQVRLEANAAAVAAARSAGNGSIFAFANHPNFLWALTAEELAAVPDVRMFEVFNGHTTVNNAGDSLHASVERIWDIALSLRHAAGAPPLFGVATDDAHHYREYGDTVARTGRGWVMVRAERLDADEIGHAMQRGDFYASTGVRIRSEQRDARGIRIEIEPEEGVTYRTYFIGTRTATPLDGAPVTTAAGDTLRTTRRYADGVGAVLAQVDGTRAEYVFTGDERYVRAQVVSSKLRSDAAAMHAQAQETAWLQPVFREIPR